MPPSTLAPAQIITHLSLRPHPEGGHFAETFRDAPAASPSSPVTPNQRPHSTLIYYLLTFPDFSALHRLDAAEVWHYYGGNAGLEVVELVADEGGKGTVKVTRLGMDLEKGERPQCVVRGGVWFGARVAAAAAAAAGEEGVTGKEGEGEERWALVGCTVAPGFLFERFEMGRREVLLEEFPGCEEVIGEMTRA